MLQKATSAVKVRIKQAPAETELDGIKLERFTKGSIREAAPTTAAWLIAEGYAEPEMRDVPREEEQFYSARDEPHAVAHDRRRHSRR